MKKKLSIGVWLPMILCSLFFQEKPVCAQNNECATDFFHQHRMQDDTAYRNQILSVESQIAAILQSNTTKKPEHVVYTIPVVVHVIHLGEPVGTGTNISDFQIQVAVAGLTNHWRNTVGNGVDVEIEFCLASRDPAGKSTTGINRVDGSGITNYSTQGISLSGCSTGAAENSVKALSRWPVGSYYNIWVVSEICDGGWGGWTYYPNGGVNDGATIISNSFTGSSTLPTHEVGHGFFAYHTFEGDGGNASCPLDTNCTTGGDKVCDTPPHKQNDCGSSNPCTASGTWLNSRYNYMSYCGGLDRFTQGQKDRMRAVAQVSPRLSLLTSLGCQPPVGIEENSPMAVHVYPNPSEGKLTIEMKSNQNGLFEIYNLLGEKIFHAEVSAAQSEINLNISGGIYFYLLKNEQQVIGKGKLIIQ